MTKTNVFVTGAMQPIVNSSCGLPSLTHVAQRFISGRRGDSVSPTDPNETNHPFLACGVVEVTDGMLMFVFLLGSKRKKLSLVDCSCQVK